MYKRQAGEDSSQETSYRAGEYRGVAQGYAGELTAFVTLTDSHIDAIRVPDCPETEGIGSVAVEQLPGLIVANQTFAVDVVCLLYTSLSPSMPARAEGGTLSSLSSPDY